MRHGEDPAAADLYTGTLTSPEFTIERKFIHFRIGGGAEPNKLGLRLIIDGKEVRRAAGRSVGPMRRDAFDVRDLQGKKARLQIVDQATGGWGHTTVDQIVFSDRPIHQQPSDVPGYGSMALDAAWKALAARLIMAADLNASGSRRSGNSLRSASTSRVRSPPSRRWISRSKAPSAARSRSSPARSATFDFVLSWWFPFYGQKTGEMAAITDSQKLNRHYIRRFDSAAAVADYVADHFDRLAGQTRLWNETWYDSTLAALVPRPHVHAASTAWRPRRFTRLTTAATGAGKASIAVAGTCQHVWQYAQSVARLFPAIERDLRERVDFGLAWHDNGAMDFRAENDRHVAHDGFCGTIIRAYREHQMAPDQIVPDAHLAADQAVGRVHHEPGPRRRRPARRRADEHARYRLVRAHGLDQHALPCRARRPVPRWPTRWATRPSPHVAARSLRPGERAWSTKLYNGEYFIHRPPDYTHNNTNIGCHSDQMLGPEHGLPGGLAADRWREGSALGAPVAVAVQLHARRRPLPREVQDDSRRPMVRHARRGRTSGDHLPPRRGRQGDGQELGVRVLLQRMLDWF